MRLRLFSRTIPRKRSGWVIGQGLVEFALVIPILLTLIFGIFEAGRAVWVYTSVAAASREAARLGSSVSCQQRSAIAPYDCITPPYYLDCDAIIAQAIRMSGAANVTEDDVTISYDRGPSTANLGSCPIAADTVQLGDRIIVQVVGHFTPAAAMPLFTFPTFDITSETRRTIVKEVDLGSSGASGSTATSTTSATPNGPTNTPTITLTPSTTPTPSRTPTSGPTNTPTLTVTPAGVQPPIYLNVSNTQDGNNCKWLIIGIRANPAWTGNPGYGPSNYKISWVGSLSGSTWVGSNYPNDVLWETWQTLSNGNAVTYTFIGVFNWPLESLPSTVTLQCVNGTVVQQ